MINIEIKMSLKFCKNGILIEGENPINLVNKSEQSVRVTVLLHTSNLFRWNSLNEILANNGSTSIQVIGTQIPFFEPPSLVDGDMVTERMIINVQGISTNESKTIEIPISVQYPIQSESIVINMVPNPPGGDLDAPGGEFIDIINVSGKALNINGLTIKHLVFPSGESRDLVTLSGIPEFPAGKMLRVFTRKKDARDPTNNFDQTNLIWFYYVGRKAAVWNNNESDTAFIYNQCKSNIVQQTFVKSGSNLEDLNKLEQVSPPERIDVDPRKWTKVLSELGEGDVIRITNASGAISWFNFFNGGRVRLPDGREKGNNHTKTAPSGPQRSELKFERDENNQPVLITRFFPLPGANEGSLLGFLCTPINSPDGEHRQHSLFEDGLMIDIGNRNTDIIVPEHLPTISGSSDHIGPFDFYLGVNDDVLHDNGGFFSCTVEHLRFK